MPLWVQLDSIQRLEVRGKLQAFYPGDWIKVGRQQALRWIAEGSAHTIGTERARLMEGCGVVARQDSQKLSMLDGSSIKYKIGQPELAYPHTLIWNPTLTLRMELLPAGFNLLRKWQAAVPLMDYDVLLQQMGSAEEKARTKALTHDLRILAYDTRLIFARQCPETEQLLQLWREEDSGNETHAFVRALWRIPLLICALPITWVGKGPR